MPDAFSELSRRILELAHEEAIRLDHEQVGPAHLLLALLREETNRPGQVLRKVSVAGVRMEMKRLEGDSHPDKHSYPIPQSNKLQKAIDCAIEAARLAEAPGLVVPDHLLAGLLSDREGIVTQILQNLKVDLEDIHVAFLKRRFMTSPRPITWAPGSSGIKADSPPREIETAVEDTAQPRDAGNAAQAGVPDLRSDPFAQFTDQARKVMQLATQEAQRSNHDYLGTEHILLGIVKNGSSVAAFVLRELGFDLPTIRLEVEKIVQRGAADTVTPGKLPPTPRARKAIVFAVEEAHKFLHEQVGTEHLLLGLLRVENCVAWQILGKLGRSREDVRWAMVRLLEKPS
jgi:ATP-dependent Clp protease ATP-binding subunit ClpA